MMKATIAKMEEDLIRYFLDYTSFDESSPGYGLTLDHSLNDKKASIAATGFMFPALILAHEKKMITKTDLQTKVIGTLKTLENVHTYHGFFPHFIDMTTGERYRHCEYSTIDTTLMFFGLLAIDQYMKDDGIHVQVLGLLKNINWKTFISEESKYLKMAYNPNVDGDYVEGNPGFISRWDMFAEQLMMYVIMAGLLDDPQLSRDIYNQFTRHQEGSLIYPPHNTLFIYHMPLCFLDARELTDINGINWHQNAVKGTMSHIETARLYQKDYPTFSKGFFGMNASDTKEGYRVFGALPNIENKIDTDGTIAPYSIIGSLPYISEAKKVLDGLFDIPGLYQSYGFMDAFQIDSQGTWISKKYISIDKGIELLSLQQLTSDLIRKLVMEHPLIQKGLDVLQFSSK